MKGIIEGEVANVEERIGNEGNRFHIVHLRNRTKLYCFSERLAQSLEVGKFEIFGVEKRGIFLKIIKKFDIGGQ